PVDAGDVVAEIERQLRVVAQQPGHVEPAVRLHLEERVLGAGGGEVRDRVTDLGGQVVEDRLSVHQAALSTATFSESTACSLGSNLSRVPWRAWRIHSRSPWRHT